MNYANEPKETRGGNNEEKSYIEFIERISPKLIRIIKIDLPKGDVLRLENLRLKDQSKFSEEIAALWLRGEKLASSNPPSFKA